LKDLDDVFGNFIDTLPVNILVVRKTIDSEDAEVGEDEEHEDQELE
jgi:hypothetical protein